MKYLKIAFLFSLLSTALVGCSSHSSLQSDISVTNPSVQYKSVPLTLDESYQGPNDRIKISFIKLREVNKEKDFEYKPDDISRMINNGTSLSKLFSETGIVVSDRIYVDDRIKVGSSDGKHKPKFKRSDFNDNETSHYVAYQVIEDGSKGFIVNISAKSLMFEGSEEYEASDRELSFQSSIHVKYDQPIVVFYNYSPYKKAEVDDLEFLIVRITPES